MKTKFSIILSSLALAMSVGAGLSISNRNKSAEPVEATYSQTVTQYYSSIDWNETGATLKSHLNGKIKIDSAGWTYDGLWTCYLTSDTRSDGYLWDIYSDKTSYTTSSAHSGTSGHNSEGDYVNREHIIPQSTFDEDPPMKSDAHHVLPSDGYVNGVRSSWAHGNVTSASITTNDGCKRGTGTGGGTVFEPKDCYKGDIARIYFYFVTCYEHLLGSSVTNAGEFTAFDFSTYKSYKTAFLNVYLQWAKDDPVSQKEIDRNNAIYAGQGNRNPYIDCPYAVGAVFDPDNATDYGTKGEYTDGQTDTVSLSVSPSTKSIEVGDSFTLTASASGGTGSVSWDVTSGANYVSLDGSGNSITVTGEADGTATVRASYSGKTANCTVTVTSSGGGGGGGQSVDADPETFTMSERGYSNEQVIESINGTNCTITFDKGTNNNAPKYFTTGSAIRAYGGNTFTVSSSLNIIEIALTFASGEGSNAITSSPSGYSSNTWTGSANSVTFTIGGTSGHRRISSITVTYESSGSTQATLSSITLDTTNVTKTFSVGATFNYTGLVVTAHYDDTTSATVNPTSVSSPDMSSAGNKTITVSYTEGGVTKTATYSITVNAVTLSSITVSGQKTAYYVGDTFVKPAVTAHWSDSSTSDVTNSATFNGYNLSNAGNQTVSVSYGGQSTSYSITVTAVSLTSISITGYTTAFTVGDTFSFGGTVTANYNNGSSSDVTASATFSGYNMSTAGNQTVTVSYGGQTKTYQITVNEQSSATDSTQYSLINSTSDLEAGKSYIITNGTSGTVKAIAVTSNDSNRKTTSATVSSNKITRGSSIMSFTLGGSSGAWTFATENYAGTAGYLASAASGNNNYLRVISNPGTATISFSSDEAVINIGPHTSRTQIRYNTSNLFACYSSGQDPIYLWKEVSNKTLSSITLDTSNVQTTFSVGDTFNYTGLVVTAHYSDSSSNVVTPKTVSSPNMSTTGQKSVTVTYEENDVSKSASYNITVNTNPTLTWTAPTINTFSGTSLTSTDANSWGVTYNNGSGSTTNPTYGQFTVKLGGTTISLPYTWQPADDGKTLCVSYSTLTTATTTVSIVQELNAINMVVPGSSATSDLTFTAACGGSGTADDEKGWTVTSDGTESNFDSTKGIHYGTSGAAVQYIKLTSTAFGTNLVTKVVVQASTASGVSATVSVKVGGSAFGGDAQSLTTSNASYTFTGSASGTIEVTITKPSNATKAIYCKGVAVTYATSSSSENIANVAGHEDAQRAAVKYAKAFNTAMATTSYCTTNISSAWSTCSSAYTTFLSEAASLGSTEETYAKNLIKNATAQYSDDSGEACVERMLKTYEVCVSKHGQTAFMSDLVTVGSNNVSPLVNIVGDNKCTIIIVLVSLLSASTIAGYFFIKRRRPE